MRHFIDTLSERFNRGSIRMTMFASFTLSAILAVLFTGITLYARFSVQLDSTIEGENQMLVEQVNQSLGTYLRNMIRLSDSLYYNVVKNTDLTENSVSDEMRLLYNTYSDYIENIVLFSDTGELVATAPPAKLRTDVDVTQEDWFRAAMDRTENLHFSVPAVQRLFMEADNSFKWVISLSCAVELTRGKDTQTGVLLIDLKYGPVAEIFNNVKLSGTGYVYLSDAEGNLIYPPDRQSIASGLMTEDSRAAAAHSDGIYRGQSGGEKRSIIVRGVGYTGWKVVGVVDQPVVSVGTTQDFLFIVVIFCAYFELLIFINFILSKKLTDPIQNLEKSVRDIEQYRDSKGIYVGGTAETRQLGHAVQRMVDQLRQLTDDIVREHEQKQKSELNALQAQINPHFLYNTLDIIVWMIENGQREDAVRVVTALARFFRISLSKGRNIITVHDELEHVRNYLLIQEMRYKNKFRYEIWCDDEAQNMSTIKLVVQPIVENAIYHSMDFMDGDGLITIRAEVKAGILAVSVSDNGLGMTPEVVERLLTTGPAEGSRRGSGIGLKNVQDRIRLYFGGEYGVTIESEPDEGTCVTLRMPAVPYGEMEES